MKRARAAAAFGVLGMAVWACGDDDPAGPGGGDTSSASTAASTTSASSSTGNGGDGGSGGWDPRFDALAQALQEDLEDNDAYGVSVAVMEAGQVRFAAAFGSKDAEGVEPLTPQTLMQIGSTTKQMTATGLLRKVDAGALAIDDTLEETLPMLEFALDPTWDDQATMHHLLSHQGGFLDFVEWAGTSNDDGLADLFYGEYAQEGFLMSPPGAFWNYSNPNFSYAGLVTQELDTRAWADLMIEDVFLPLGMTRTYTRKTAVEADGDFAIGFGYTLGDLQNGGSPGKVAMNNVGDPASGRPAGMVWTTPTQMMQWATFIMNGNPTVLSDALREQITTGHVSTLYLNGAIQYGYGMDVWEGFLTNDGIFYPTPVWAHGGNTLSFTNDFWILPEHDFAICITVSGYGTDFSHSVDVAIETLLALPEPIEPPMYTVDPSTFGRHVGTYDDPYNVGQMIIADAGGTLTIAMPDLEALNYTVSPNLTAISSDLFLVTIDGQPYDLTFIPQAPGGDSVYIRNRGFVTTRIQATPTAAATSTPKADRATIDRLLLESRLGPRERRIWKAAQALGTTSL